MLHTPQDLLWQELAYLGRYLHWSLDELLDLTHRDRIRLIRSIAAMGAHEAGGRFR